MFCSWMKWGEGWEPLPDADVLRLAAALCAPGRKILCAVLAPSVLGVWSDWVGEQEVIRLGYPIARSPRELDPFDPSPRWVNLFARHWERMVFGRRIDVVISRSGRAAGPLRAGIAGQTVRWWAAWDSPELRPCSIAPRRWSLLDRWLGAPPSAWAAPEKILLRPGVSPPPINAQGPAIIAFPIEEEASILARLLRSGAQGGEKV